VKAAIRVSTDVRLQVQVARGLLSYDAVQLQSAMLLPSSG
jgi:hypothetical protein